MGKRGLANLRDASVIRALKTYFPAFEEAPALAFSHMREALLDLSQSLFNGSLGNKFLRIHVLSTVLFNMRNKNGIGISRIIL